MVKILIIVLVILALTGMTFNGCANDKIIDGKNYETYGLFNKDNIEDQCIKYEVSMLSTILGVIFIQTIIAPIYVFGFSLWEPVEAIKNCGQTSISNSEKEF